MREPARQRAAATTWFLAVALALWPMLAAATPSQCKRPELAWEAWLAFTRANNPGIEFIELEPRARSRILAEFSCAGGGPDCPPDHAYAFHCRGNAMVLVVFVKTGCVTLAEELSVEHFLRVVGGEFEC